MYLTNSEPIKEKDFHTHTTINCKPDQRNYNKCVNSTELSKLVLHKLKNEGEEYKLNWKILEKVNKHKPGKKHESFA